MFFALFSFSLFTKIFFLNYRIYFFFFNYHFIITAVSRFAFSLNGFIITLFSFSKSVL